MVLLLASSVVGLVTPSTISGRPRSQAVVHLHSTPPQLHSDLGSLVIKVPVEASFIALDEVVRDPSS